VSCPDSMTSVGATIQYDADGTPPFTDIGGVKSITYNGLTTEVKDADSLTSWFKEKCPGKLDGGQITFTVKMTKARLTILVDMQKARTMDYWRVIFPTLDTESAPSHWEATGFITSVGTEFPEDGGEVTVPVTVEVTGEPDFVEGTDIP
jgi:hypothetical protein